MHKLSGAMWEVILPRISVALIETGSRASFRLFQIFVDGVESGQIELLESELVGISVGDYLWGVWAGCSLYSGQIGRPGLKEHTQNEPVHEVYAVGSVWYLVRELSVVVLDPSSAHILARFDHDEVLIESRRSGEELVVRDLQNRTFAFTLDASAPTLVPRAAGDVDTESS